MKKSFWLKLCVLVLAISMVVSLAACNGGKIEDTTEAPKQQTTEAPEKNTTEAPDNNTTEAPGGDDGDKLPEADSTLTLEQAIALGLSMEHNTYTEGKYYVVGVIDNVYNTQYGNFVLIDEDGNEFTIYGSYSANGETRYDMLDTRPVAGDTVKVYGIIGQYNGTAQIKNGWIVEHTPATPTTTEAPTTESTEAPTTETTEAPTTETTEAPTTETTEAPTTETTEAPTTETTEAPAGGETTEAPECDHVPGNEWKHNGEKHWKECECGQKHNEAAHVGGDDWHTDGEKHWKECECGAKFDEAGHASKVTPTEDESQHFLQCSVCLKDLSAPGAHEFECDEAGVSHKCACGVTEACGSTYDITDTQHGYTVGCTVCGITAGMEAHSYPTVVTPGETATTYAFKCSCGKQLHTWTVSNDVNYYTAPGMISNNWRCDGNEDKAVITGTVMSEGEGDAKIWFTRMNLTASSSFKFNNGTSEITRDYAPTDTLNGGSGKFAVLKIRMSGAVRFKFIANTDESKSATDSLGAERAVGSGNKSADAQEGNNVWRTYVINLDNINANYTANSTDILKAAFGMQFIWDSTPVVDIAYFAIVDSWEEVAEVTGEATAYQIKDWKNDNVICPINTADGSCANHKMAIRVEGTLRTPYCTYCGHDFTDLAFTVPENVNYYSAPGQQINNWATGYSNNSNGGYVGDFGIYTNPDDETDTFIYNRVSFWSSGSMLFGNGTGTGRALSLANTISGGTGRYAVLKMRVVETAGLSYFYFAASDGKNIPVKENGDTDSDKWYGTSGGANVRAAAGIPTGEWVTYVIDLNGINTTYYATGDTSVTKIDVGMRIGGTSATIDFAYLAIVDDWSEITGLLGENEQVEFVSEWSAHTKDATRTSGNECVDHMLTTTPNNPVYPETLDPKLCYTASSTTTCANEDCKYSVDSEVENHGHATPVQTKDGNAWVYTCPTCHNVLDRIEVTVGSGENEVNYFVAPTLKSAYGNWNAGAASMGGGWIGSVEYDANEEIAYLSVKAWGGASFEITNDSTKTPARGCADLDSTTQGKGRYGVLKVRVTDDITGGLKFCVTDTSGTWADSGYLRASVPVDTWMTYVIDLSTAYSGKYTVAEGSANIGVSFMNSMGSGTVYYGNIDIAYFAICDNWTEVKAVIGDDDVVIAESWKDPSKDSVRKSDGVTCAGEGYHKFNSVESDAVYTHDANGACYTCTVTTTCTNGTCDYNNVETNVSKEHVTATRNVNQSEKLGNDDKVCYTYDRETYCKNSGCDEVISTESGLTVGHVISLVTSTEGTVYTYTYKCANCSYVYETRTVDISATDTTETTVGGVNYYITAHTAMRADLWNTGNPTLMYDSDDEVAFARINFKNGGSLELVSTYDTATAGISSRDGTQAGGSGQYLVVKIRVGIGEGMVRFMAFDGSDQTPNDGWGWVVRDTGVATIPEWRVFVIDMSVFRPNDTMKFYTPGSDSDKVFLGVKGDADDGANDYIDIAYVAICDDWAEIDSVVGNDSVVVSSWSTTEGEVAKTSTEIDALAAEAKAATKTESAE